MLHVRSMETKRVIWIGAVVGSLLGGCVPGLWHAPAWSMSGLLFSTIGGLAGIWLGYRLTR